MTNALALSILGPPGGGKTTLASGLCHQLSISRIAIGERLRGLAGSDDTLRRTLSSGGFVSDEAAWGLVAADIRIAVQNAQGFLLDGFPRTVGQVELLDDVGGLSRVFCLSVGEVTASTRIHLRSRSRDPRADDLTLAAVRQRLQHYIEQTRPVIDVYRHREILTFLDATRTPGQILASALQAINEDVK
ncbi:MAG TPA: nucleoside monophosphate kinase [Solirubrobacterales bacterium]